MATKISMEFLVGLIITLIVFAIILVGCNKALSPKCDLTAGDAFKAFNNLYKDCMNVNENKICKCGEFDIKNLPLNHKIIVSPAIKDGNEVVRSSLVCNGRNAGDPAYFENPQGDEKIKIYFSDPTKFEKASDPEVIKLHQSVKEKIGTEEFYWIYSEQGDKIRENKIYISEEILQDGFEIENELNSHYIKNVGLLFGVNKPLTLLYLNGKVAFMAKTKTQGNIDIMSC